MLRPGVILHLGRGDVAKPHTQHRRDRGVFDVGADFPSREPGIFRLQDLGRVAPVQIAVRRIPYPAEVLQNLIVETVSCAFTWSRRFPSAKCRDAIQSQYAIAGVTIAVPVHRPAARSFSMPSASSGVHPLDVIASRQCVAQITGVVGALFGASHQSEWVWPAFRRRHSARSALPSVELLSTEDKFEVLDGSARTP